MWVPIALSRDIPEGVTRAVILDGQELVAWRDQSGSMQVWEDRCPHRGMRLSYGFVRGDRLNCLYHGWEYGADASCHRIPAHPDLAVPATIRVKAFAAAEIGGMVLVELSGSRPAFARPSGAPVASIALDADIGTVLEACRPQPLSELQAFEVTLDGLKLTVGWHVVRVGHIMLHAVADQSGTEARALAALHRLRTTIERRAA